MTTAAHVAAGRIDDWVAGYRNQIQSGYDECVGADGEVRAHWRSFITALEALSDEERLARSKRLDRRVRETGIAYDIFADPTKVTQRWRLDLAPVIISQAEWRWLETALLQRARLFDALLRDVYGPRETLRRGLVPAELIFADPAYLTPCQNVPGAAEPLFFYAADLARGADGRWRVIDSHTETNAGIGFALANRVAHTHVAGDLFKACNALRLAGYFQSMQGSLSAYSGRDNARIALLTPGPHHEDYFSHAYLARYLGFLLVDGADLRTKGGQVYLKTLEGLKEIDLLVRCVDGRAADPLELDPSGFLGPAGLLSAWRRSPRLIVNAVGSAMAQNRGLGAFLPKLAEYFLDEALLIADAPRRWLGDAEARDLIGLEPDRFVIRKAQEGTGRPGRAALGEIPHPRDEAERAALKREIALHGARLVAEEKIGFSTAPTFTPDGLAPRPFAMRLYVVRTEQGYHAMPGGLAMTIDPARAVALTAPDGQTRDVWVTAEADQGAHVSLWKPTVETARVQRSQRVIQSRVADDLFWLGRYSERADWTMRVVRSALRRVEEDSGPATGRSAARNCLEMLLAKDDELERPNAKRADDAEIERLCMHLIASRRGPRTLDRTFNGLYRVANLVRDRLSLEAWQTLTKFRPGDAWVNTLQAASPVAALDLLDEGLASISAFNGLMHENMTRNHGWSFLDMGRRIERAYNLCEAVRTLFIPGSEPEEEASSLFLLLELADSFITYRSRYRIDPMLPLALDLLLSDEANPRSLAYQLAAVSRHLETLPDGKHGVNLPEDRRLILGLLTSIRLANIEQLSDANDRRGLAELMEAQTTMLPELSNAVSRHYFNLTEDAPQRLQTRVEPKP